MTDRLSPERRSALMSRVRAKDTKPELVVRRLLHRAHYRYRLHRRDLPGTPDLVFPSRRKAILVHGCFWHGHPGCKLAKVPSTRVEFWSAKIERNRARDVRKEAELSKLGWNTLVVWDCETRQIESLMDKLCNFLGPPGHRHVGTDMSIDDAT